MDSIEVALWVAFGLTWFWLAGLTVSMLLEDLSGQPPVAL